jgi:hypothetical protein
VAGACADDRSPDNRSSGNRLAGSGTRASLRKIAYTITARIRYTTVSAP